MKCNNCGRSGVADDKFVYIASKMVNNNNYEIIYKCPECDSIDLTYTNNDTSTEEYLENL